MAPAEIEIGTRLRRGRDEVEGLVFAVHRPDGQAHLGRALFGAESLTAFDVVMTTGEFVFGESEAALRGPGWTVSGSCASEREVAGLTARATLLESARIALEALEQAGMRPAVQADQRRAPCPSIGGSSALARDTRCSRTTVHRKIP
jgi:hypothetical protein